MYIFCSLVFILCFYDRIIISIRQVGKFIPGRSHLGTLYLCIYTKYMLNNYIYPQALNHPSWIPEPIIATSIQCP